MRVVGGASLRRLGESVGLLKGVEEEREEETQERQVGKEELHTLPAGVGRVDVQVLYRQGCGGRRAVSRNLGGYGETIAETIVN